MLTVLIFPATRIVESLTPKMSTECEISVSSSVIVIGCVSPTKFSYNYQSTGEHTITHLTPSNVFLPALWTAVVLLPLAFLRSPAGFSGSLGLAFFSLNEGFL